MQKAMFIQLTAGLLIGGGLGAVMGYFGKCTSGACPLTANPWRGAFVGALMGGLFAFSAGSSRSNAGVGGDHAALQIGGDADFDREVLKADKPVLVDFYSDSCGPCRMLAPTIEKLAKEYEGRALVYKVDVTRLPQLAGRYGIQGIPAVLFFKEGKEVGRLVGLRSQREYAQALDRLVGGTS
jgi:thioredoxin 1